MLSDDTNMQLETYSEAIEQDLRPAVCERRQTDRLKENYSIDIAFATKLTLGCITFSNIVNKELLFVENPPHGHMLYQVYLKAQSSARYSFSLILMICQIISIRQSACLLMTVYYTEK